ncbi:hypothetical protein TNCV_218251 [Trichonephila clavipes]|nr:hypothetical protein TNCV_218251 [Trichonephila clavipes]
MQQKFAHQEIIVESSGITHCVMPLEGVEFRSTWNIKQVSGVCKVRAANWSHRSLYPASNQRTTSKLSAKPKKLKTLSTQMKNHSRTSWIPSFNQSPSCHSAKLKSTTFAMPSIPNAQKKNAYC